MTVDILNKNLCTGCTACFSVCPVKAITMTESEQGFFEPVIDYNKCINCGKCEKTCPVLHPSYENDRAPACYAARYDDETRRDSSSGGMFSALADYTIEKGGYVCGAALTSDFFVEHRIVSDKKGVKELRRSKYVMSRLGDVFIRIKQLLDSGKYVMFAGCPCQAAGLKNYLAKPYDNLLLVDLVCHGAPPQKVFRKYLEETYGIKNLSGFKFRTKKYGYNSFTQIAEFKNGNTEGRDYSFDYYEKVMHSGLALKDICGDCQFAPAPRQGDISVGDFWGISKYDPALHDGLGTSVLLANNKKGAKVIAQISAKLKHITPVPFDFARANNRFGRKVNIPQGRRWFYTMLKTQPFEKSARYALTRKFNVGLVGLWYGRNYGSMATYYALHHFLTKEAGQSVLMIENCLKPDDNSENTKTSPRLIAAKYYDVSAKYTTDGLSQLNDRCETYIVGSDQLWNVNLSRPYKQTYFLGFAEDKNKKIAYGTSFGKAYEGTEQEKLISSYFLKRFDHLSIRDKLSEEICKKQFGIKNVTQVCDPTFLCPAEEYGRLAEKSALSEKEPYILAYILDTHPKIGEALSRIGKKYNKKICVILDEPPKLWESNKAKLEADKYENIEVKRDVDLHEWLWYYKNAEAVITDSFHGTIFSIIFRKPFLAKINEMRGGQRFVSLLEPIGLSDRLCRNFEELANRSRTLYETDYSEAEKKLNKIVTFSRQWLLDAIKN